VTLAAVYVAIYLLCYRVILHAQFGYVGYDLYQRDAVFMALSVAIAVAPVLSYRGYRGISSLIAVCVYLALYVPIVLTFALGFDGSLSQALTIELTFLVGMVLLFLADLIVIRNPLRMDLGMNLMPLVFAITAAALAYTIILYRGSFSFSGFGQELYDLRSENEALGSGLAARYITSWLSSVLVPLCLAYGLTSRRWHYVVLGTSACLALYMGAANKISILLPFVYVAFYTLLRNRLRRTFVLLTAGLSAVMAVLAMTAASPDSAAFLVSAILINRTIGNGGLLAMKYYEFFSFHPRTAYSHVNGINLFTKPYPYGDQILGQVVGQHYWSVLTNANASFWATDGIAAIGLAGVIVASVFCVALFLAMNTFSRAYDQLFVVLCFLPFIVTLLNQSLFSSVWSGGAFFLLLFFIFGRPAAATGAPRPQDRDASLRAGAPFDPTRA